MTATNHVLTGTLIGLTLHQPLLAVVVALASHFVLDAMPHYGDANHTQKKFITVLICDMLLASLVLVALMLLQPTNWQLAWVCGVTAASPDLMWLPMWIRELKHMSVKRSGSIKRFHKKIQWAERPHNYVVEVAWGITMCALLVRTINI